MDPHPARHRMVERQIERRGVRDARVLEAMRRVPRERFVPEGQRDFAYEDSPLPIEEGQTISQPYIVARMVEAARVGAGDRVLEIGTGSGYAAAVLAEVAGRVYTIERHEPLANLARDRIEALGIGNVRFRVGDGSLGWPDAAPFDAIVVAAAGPRVPHALREQLAQGGRLVMPVGERDGSQRLVRVTRVRGDEYVEEALEDVRFVPLIGEGGWRAGVGDAAVPGASRGDDPADVDHRVHGDDEAAPGAARAPVHRAPTRNIPELIAQAAERLPDPASDAFGASFDRYADARVVLLGECTHGTHEFYAARAAITRRLVERHGFTIVAVEADWPDAATINRDVRGVPPRPDGEAPFTRFPTWMWRNADVDAFVAWLRAWNRGRAPEAQAGFYGLDLYNLNASMRAVIDYLDRVDPEAARVARARYGCLTPWQNEPQSYGRMALSRGYAPCEKAVVEMLRQLLERRVQYASHDGETFLDATANARLVRDAERYYRAMYYGGAESWNLRDRHMFETLCQLLEAKGSGARAVVWAHNSHVGDARYTDMGAERDELNIGQLCRERFGSECALVGFGTHDGAVACAHDWDAPMQVKAVNPSRPDSYERLAHESGVPRFLLDLRAGRHDALHRRLLAPRLERFIGVIYRPDTERWSHYAEATLPRQFDAYVWFDRTSAVTPT